jgi:quinol monooxygenase YgiN
MAYVVSAYWRAKEGKADRLAEVIEELLEPSRAEEGNVFYQAHRSPDDPQQFYLYEQYRDEAAYEAHQATEHFTRLVKEDAIPELLDERRREFWSTLVDERGGL